MSTYTTPAHVSSAITALVGPVPLVRTRATVAAYFDRRAETALHLAELATNLAEYALSVDSLEVVEDALVEAREFFAEWQNINSMRVQPV